MSITLALESAIAGGSVSLLDGNDEIARWIGASDVSKAEDLLLSIDALLSKNRLSSRDIGLIAVSAGPGSFTGIRIGLATAFGLKDGLGIGMRSVPALTAIAAAAANVAVSVAIPTGRNSVCLQQFAETSACPAYALDHERFVELVRRNDQNKYVVHERLYSSELQLPNIANFGSNVAKALGTYAINNPNVSVEPLFISKATE